MRALGEASRPGWPPSTGTPPTCSATTAWRCRSGSRVLAAIARAPPAVSPGTRRDGARRGVALVMWVLGRTSARSSRVRPPTPTPAPSWRCSRWPIGGVALARPGPPGFTARSRGDGLRHMPIPPGWPTPSRSSWWWCRSIAWVVGRGPRAEPTNHVDVNISHVAMGWPCPACSCPDLNLLPDGLWEAVFVTIALWFSWQGARFVCGGVGRDSPDTTVSHYLIHLVMALAMMYMYLAAVPASGRAAPCRMTAPTGAGADFVGLPLLFVAVLFRIGDLATRRPEPVRTTGAEPVAWRHGQPPSARQGRGRPRPRPGSPRALRRARHPGRSPTLFGAAPGDGLSHRHVHHHGVHARPHAL